MSSVYDTVPLQHGASTNIRVLEILDATEPHSLIRCKFHTISLSNATPYTALSYTWGSPDDAKLIEVNGQIFEARKNLWDFL